MDLPEDFIMVTMDVTSLYTNIPNHEGLVAVARTLVRYRARYRLSNQSIIQLLKHVLHCNNFQFNGEHYLHIGGTSMGTKVDPPSFANIFMGELEHKMLDSAPSKPHTYFRFIEYIYIIWTRSERELLLFYEHCNTFHHSIKFTIDYSKESITFLDTVTFRSGN